MLAVQTNCGQVDVKAVFTGNGDARGRVAGPYITTADDCIEHADDGGDDRPADHRPDHRAPTAASTTPSSAAVTTLPSGSTPTSSGSSALSNRALPETGSDAPLLLALSAALVVAGVVLVTKGRARNTLPE